MKFSKTLASMAAAAALLAAPLASQAALVIDDFSVSQAEVLDTTSGAFLPAPTSAYSTNIANDAGSGSSQAGAAANIIGGQRDLLVYKSSGTGHATASVEFDELVFDSDNGTNGFAVVRWDGAGTTFNQAIDTDGLGGVDLASSGVAIGIDSDADLAYQLTFQVWSETAPGTWTLSEVTKNVGSGLQAVTMLFSDFTGVNFASVGAMQMIVNTGALTQRLDVNLEIIGTVPEPGSVALAGLALLGLAATRRRKA